MSRRIEVRVHFAPAPKIHARGAEVGLDAGLALAAPAERERHASVGGQVDDGERPTQGHSVLVGPIQNRRDHEPARDRHFLADEEHDGDVAGLVEAPVAHPDVRGLELPAVEQALFDRDRVVASVYVPLGDPGYLQNLGVGDGVISVYAHECHPRVVLKERSAESEHYEKAHRPESSLFCCSFKPRAGNL